MDKPEQPSVQPPFSGAPFGKRKGLRGKSGRRKNDYMFPCHNCVCITLSVLASSSYRADSSSRTSSCAMSWRTLTGRAASSCRAGWPRRSRPAESWQRGSTKTSLSSETWRLSWWEQRRWAHNRPGWSNNWVWAAAAQGSLCMYPAVLGFLFRKENLY